MDFDFPLFPEQASTLASKVDALFLFSVGISTFFSLLIAVFIFVFFVRFRRRRAGEIGMRGHHSVMLEVVWSIVPFVITMVLFGWGTAVFLEATTAPADATEYFATGKQWMWKFQHPEGQREINTLHVPVGEKIKLTMTSEDVIHSFYVPAFRVKQDVIPGRYTTVWFEATKTGTYHLFCAEYCGAEHARMGGKVIVMEPDDYQAWLTGTGAVVAPRDMGTTLFEQYVCNTCHYEDASGRGPSLVGIAGKEVKLGDGRTLVRDDEYLRTSILRSGEHIVEGYLQIMPVYQGQISEVGVQQLITYIKSLGGGGEPAAAPAVPGADPAADPGETTGD